MKPHITHAFPISPIFQSLGICLIGLLIFITFYFSLKPLISKLKKNGHGIKEPLLFIPIGLLIALISIIAAINLYINPIKGIGNYYAKKTFVVGTGIDNKNESTVTLINENENTPYQIEVSQKQAQYLTDDQVLEIKTKTQLLRKNDWHKLTLSHFKNDHKDIYFKVKNANIDSEKWIKPNEKG